MFELELKYQININLTSDTNKNYQQKSTNKNSLTLIQKLNLMKKIITKVLKAEDDIDVQIKRDLKLIQTALAFFITTLNISCFQLFIA